eukprot:Seg8007.1 transcript_id=Seg8007.1/GoldUCD/mRNA.D3Y31 product="hypothetical protein" protein_id=Seg8007.1/GoldUCD/D3Y31
MWPDKEMNYGFLLAVAVVLTYVQECKSMLPVKMLKMMKFQQKNTRSKNCSVHRSAIIRKILANDFFPIYEKYNVDVPTRCPLHKERDIFTWIERNKSETESISLQCELCGKQFYEEYHFYEHANRKHSDVFLKKPSAVCLPSYCDIFRCDLHEKYPYHIPETIDCNEKKTNNLRRRCEALLRSCLPDKMFHYVYDKLYMAICSTLTCEKFLHPFKDSMSVFTVVTLSITVPVSLFILAHICLLVLDKMENPEAEEIFRQKKRAEYAARNAGLDARFHAARDRGFQIRQRTAYRHYRVRNGHPRYNR